MKGFFAFAALWVSSGCGAWGASNAETIVKLLDQAAPVDAKAHQVEITRLAFNEDTRGIAQFLLSANWERAVIPLGLPYKQAVVHVMRAKSGPDAEKLFTQRKWLHHGIGGRGESSVNRQVVEFGYPRILMRFGDVLVDLRDFEESLPEGIKSSLVMEFESGVQEWREQSARRNGGAMEKEAVPDVTVALVVSVLAYEKAAFRKSRPAGEEGFETYDLMKCVALAPSDYEGRRLSLIVPGLERPEQTNHMATASVEVSKSSLDAPYFDDPRYFERHDGARVIKLKTSHDATEPEMD
jgi:hypothetical protein